MTLDPPCRSRPMLIAVIVSPSSGAGSRTDTVGEFAGCALASLLDDQLRGAAMSLRPAEIAPVPARTAQVAVAAFPRGCAAMRMRDELGAIYDDQMFASLFPARGQPAYSPWRLALVTVLQFAEGLPDRQAADAVRGRIDWKYALSLELTDPGFDFSVLCEFRARLIAGGLEQSLLEALLTRYRERGLLKARGRQRTDSTHVLAAVRKLNRLENVGEMLRAALNSLAAAAPDWLAQHAEHGWIDRYGRRVEDYRLPKGEVARRELAESIGADGHRLLAAVYDPAAPMWLRDLPAVQTLRRTWVQQFSLQEDRVSWRDRADLPPARTRLHSPYDTDASFGDKRTTTWIGYKAHVTETCDADAPHVITHVVTTPAPVPDTAVTAPLHAALAGKSLLPRTHFIDAGYVDADLLLDIGAEHEVELISPIRPDASWQAKAGQGYDISAFRIDWDAQVVTCPQRAQEHQLVAGSGRLGNQARPSRLRRPGLPRLPEPIPLHAGQGRLAQTDLPPRRAARGDPAGAPAPADTAMARALRRACRDRGLPVTGHAALRTTPLALRRLGQGSLAACGECGGPQRRAPECLAARQTASHHAALTPRPPDGRLTPTRRLRQRYHLLTSSGRFKVVRLP